MLMQKRRTKAFLISLIGTLIAGSFTYATVKPSISTMIFWSDVILVGKVLDVDNPGGSDRNIKIQVQEFIKANQVIRGINKLSLSYHRIGVKGDTNFQKMKEEKTDHIFFLRYVPDGDDTKDPTSFHLELADAWFGVKRSDKTLVKKIMEFEHRVEEIYER
jgi:hypothetical protein